MCVILPIESLGDTFLTRVSLVYSALLYGWMDRWMDRWMDGYLMVGTDDGGSWLAVLGGI